MMGFLGKMFLGVVILITSLVGYVLLRQWWSQSTWHEAVALEVETPAGVKTGRAVISLTFKDVLGGTGWRGGSEMRGEATVVEVAPGQFLFALLHSEYLSQKVFPELSSDNEKFISNLASARIKREIPARVPAFSRVDPPYDPRPLLVRFRDIKDPKTIEKVDPDNLAASFGPGFKLKSYTLQLLRKDEDVTRGEVIKALPWLPSTRPNMFDGSRYENIHANNRFANSIASGDFTTESSK